MNYELSLQIVLSVVEGLTPVERLNAAGDFGTKFTLNPWIIMLGVMVVGVLLTILVVRNLKHGEHNQREVYVDFLDKAGKRGLSYRESQILLHVARLAGLKHAESIFTMSKAFDIGASRLAGPNSAATMTPQQVKQLVLELSYLREKLGFQKPVSAPTEPAGTSKKPSTRAIPEGKTLQMTRRVNDKSQDVEAAVVKNEETELTVKLTVPVNAKTGELWRVRYYYGASVWEFDVSVMNINGDTLALSHSDSIRFINRRRFLRVSVYRKALLAPFSFERQVEAEGSTDAKDAFESGAAVPQFVPGAVTELAGPGLRIETALELKVGQRVAVVFDLGSYNSDGSLNNKTTEIVEDIAIVRHVKAIENGWSVAVELTGLSDSNVDKLVRLTNAEAVKANTKTQDDSSSENQNKDAEQTSVKGQ
ncbi:MAG: hypothetical protein WCZ89_06335 [Phycisphaerae bacterium]